VRKTDEFFGDVETYRKEVAIRLPVEGAQGALKLLVTSQGCADTGVCTCRWILGERADGELRAGWARDDAGAALRRPRRAFRSRRAT
jgi:hypothetical protein